MKTTIEIVSPASALVHFDSSKFRLEFARNTSFYVDCEISSSWHTLGMLHLEEAYRRFEALSISDDGPLAEELEDTVTEPGHFMECFRCGHPEFVHEPLDDGEEPHTTLGVCRQCLNGDLPTVNITHVTALELAARMVLEKNPNLATERRTIPASAGGAE